MKEVFGGSESSSKPVDATPSDVESLRKTAGNVLKGFLKQGGGPEYQGPLTADITGNEQALLGLLFQDAQGASGRQGLLQQTMAGNFLPGQGGSNPYLQSAIEAAQRPTFEALGEQLTRMLPGQFTQAGHTINPQAFAQNVLQGAAGGGQPAQNSGSSAFDRAAAIATRGATQAASDIASNLSFGAYESERDRQNQAIQLSQAEVDTTVKNLQAQALPRLIEDMGIERGIELFKSRTQELLAALSSLGQFGALTNIGQQSKSETHTGALNSIGNFIGNLPIAPR